MNTLTQNLVKNKPRVVNFVFTSGLVFILTACASAQIPVEHHDHFSFPESRVYVEEPTGKSKDLPYKVLGWVRAKAEYSTMEQEVNNPILCKNYYNKAAKQLLKEAEKADADAVIKVRSVVFMIDGKTEEYATPECSDDGAQGEILLRGIAIKFLPPPKNTDPTKSELKAAVPDPNKSPEKLPVIETD